jgi:hypothetical protein
MVCPCTHEATQPPATQTFCGPHALPHAPQLRLSLCVFAQYGVPPSGWQPVCPAEQPAPHLPTTHDSSGLHALPQAPQLKLSLFVLVQKPPPSTAHVSSPAAHTDTQVP